MPNIDNGLKVCMGIEFKDFRLELSNNLCQAVNGVISTFWQSVFNKDLADGFHERREEDPRFELRNWQKETTHNPLWILNETWDCPFKLIDLVNSLSEVSPAASVNVASQLHKEVTAVVDTVSDKLKRALDGVAISKVSRGELTVQFAEILKDIIKECYNELWAGCEKQLEAERKKDRNIIESVIMKELKTHKW